MGSSFQNRNALFHQQSSGVTNDQLHQSVEKECAKNLRSAQKMCAVRPSEAHQLAVDVLTHLIKSLETSLAKNHQPSTGKGMTASQDRESSPSEAFSSANRARL